MVTGGHLRDTKWPKWLEREFTDRKVRGSNPTSASRLPLSRLGHPGSITGLVLPSGSMAARHQVRNCCRKVRGSNSTTVFRLFLSRLGQPGGIPALVLPWSCTQAVCAEPCLTLCASCRSKPEGTISVSENAAVTPFRRLTAMPPEGSTKAEMLPCCPGLGRSSGDTEVGFEQRIMRL
ncbi:hypothetical protein T265_14831, partial [Opisthorchis viverrini]